jgi:hypothetical protein
MKFVRSLIEPKANPNFSEKWIKKEVDEALGNLVKMVNGYPDVYRCIGFCAAEDDLGSDYYYILYDGISESVIFFSALVEIDLLKNSLSNSEYGKILERVNNESIDLKITNIYEKSRYRTDLIKKSILSHNNFSLYKNRLFWDLV